MSAVLDLNSIKDTKLWKQLNSGYGESTESDLARQLAVNAEAICKKASDRIILFPYYHPQYTLHDQTHMLRVCELMSKVVGEYCTALNPIEVFLLICAAHMHDQGMVPDAEEWEQIKESSDFKVSEEKWGIDNPNLLEIRRHLNDKRYSEEEKKRLRAKEQELLDAHRTDFLRKTHGERSDQIVNKLYAADDRLNVCGRNLSQILGKLCASHVWPASQLTDTTGFRVDEAVGTYTINLRYLAVVLRLADILDLDQDRTPEVLLRTIHFASPISLEEWAKHRSVAGWEITPELVRFTMQCEHPAFQKAAYIFMDWIDHELREAHRIIHNFPRDVPTHYRLKLPSQVDRERIEPINQSYRYEDLEFSLSREEIVKLLMTDKLYQSNSLFVRELLQNSLDALRYRVALHGQGKPDSEVGTVKIEHSIDSHGYQVVRCSDNGIGMDENIIKNFLTKVGRSYYRSPEFEQQRIGFREKNVDFDPCAKFGIGFMSCFMFGDRITIYTKRDYGPERGYGDPLIVEINGLGGLLVIRDGESNQEVGTTVEITGPMKPAYLDDWTDKVQLCRVIEGYALATEFSILANTTIKEISSSIEVPTQIAKRKTFLEQTENIKYTVIEQPFSEVHSSLSGYVRSSFLVDENNIPVLKNNTAEWQINESSGGNWKIELKTRDGLIQEFREHEEPSVCIDGILVCGQLGRNEQDYRLGSRSSIIHLGDPFLLDIRESIKPVLTPARTPPDIRMSAEISPSWKIIQDYSTKAHALLWNKFTSLFPKELNNEVFWKTTLLHGAPVEMMNSEVIWNSISLPVLNEKKKLEWKSISDIEYVNCYREKIGEGHFKNYFTLSDNRRISFGDEFKKWYSIKRGYADWHITQLIARFTQLKLKNNQIIFQLYHTDNSCNDKNKKFRINRFYESIYCIQFADDLADYITAQTELRVINTLHPLVQLVEDCVDNEKEMYDDLQEFSVSLIWCLTQRDNQIKLDSECIKNGRQFRRLGILYNHLDWSLYEDKFKPPYKIWCKQTGLIEISEKELRRWATFED